MKRNNKTSRSRNVVRVNTYRHKLGISWSELADRYTIDREWMRGFLSGRHKMHTSFASSLSEDAGGDISVWMGSNNNG